MTDVILNSHHFLQGIKLENKLFEVKQSLQGGGSLGDFDENSSMERPLPDSTPQFVTLECATLLCCIQKSCDSDVFSAINESGLVYDGGVVVDQVRTVAILENIPHISWKYLENIEEITGKRNSTLFLS